MLTFIENEFKSNLKTSNQVFYIDDNKKLNIIPSRLQNDEHEEFKLLSRIVGVKSIIIVRILKAILVFYFYFMCYASLDNEDILSKLYNFHFPEGHAIAQDVNKIKSNGLLNQLNHLNLLIKKLVYYLMHHTIKIGVLEISTICIFLVLFEIYNCIVQIKNSINKKPFIDYRKKMSILSFIFNIIYIAAIFSVIIYSYHMDNGLYNILHKEYTSVLKQDNFKYPKKQSLDIFNEEYKEYNQILKQDNFKYQKKQDLFVRVAILRFFPRILLVILALFLHRWMNRMGIWNMKKYNKFIMNMYLKYNDSNNQPNLPLENQPNTNNPQNLPLENQPNTESQQNNLRNESESQKDQNKIGHTINLNIS